MSDNSDAFEDRKSEMLEDEEMPTFVSVSSKDISLPYNADGNMQLLPIDNSSNTLGADEPVGDVYETRSRSHTTEEREDEGNNENEEGSVYVLSSGDDGAYPDSSSPSNYEEVDEEEDEEDDEEIDDEEDVNCANFRIAPHFHIPDMEGIDPVEEEIDEVGEASDDFSEEEIENDPVMSDDMVLRSVKPKPKQRKRSQSMQDLSELNQYPRQTLHLTGGNQYNRVQSKVKRYIQDIKEMSKRSLERRKLSEEAIRFNNCTAKVIRDEEIVENYPNSMRRRSIKGYAEQVLKDLEMREEVCQENDENVPKQEDADCFVRRNSNLQVEEWDIPKTENHERQPMDFDGESNVENDGARLKKINMNGEVFRDGLKNVKIQKVVTLHNALNGEAQSQSIMDVRSIGYDEYMRGSSNSSVEKNSLAREEAKAKLTGAEAQSPKSEIKHNQNKALQSEIEEEPVQAIEEIQMEVTEPREDPKPKVEPEISSKMDGETLAHIALIQSQLNQKTTQCKEIREVYEKTLSENFELKQELEDLKKTLTKLNAKKSTPQLVTVAIQTDPPPSSSEPKDVSAKDNSLKPIISTSSMGSAISYNDRWAESAGSLPISNGSARPMPNLTPLSNAEDSFIGVPGTPPRTPRQPSHSFKTSSRIIKMLSSITQRGSKVEAGINKEESVVNACGKTVNNPAVSNFNPLINHRISNKRKASETPESSNFFQPSKIPYTPGSSHRFHKRTKSEFKNPGDFIKPNSDSFVLQSNDANRTQENCEDETCEEADSRVKCFTYRDDDNSLETSFLIQAEEEGKGQEGTKDGERPSTAIVRECGPYLLGNVEVRMTEINGTINIWGKEVSQENNAEDEPEEEINIENELNESGACARGLQTPKPRHSNNGPISCSTNKKPKMPPSRLTEFGCLKNHNSPLPSGPRASISAMDNIRERHHFRNSPNFDAEGYLKSLDGHSNSCHVNKSKLFPPNFVDEEPMKNIPKNDCGCNWEREKCQYSSCGRVCRHYRGEHDCAWNTPNPQTTGRCSRLNSGKDNEQSKTDDNPNRNNFSCCDTNCGEENLFAHHGARKNNAFEDDEEDVFRRPSTSSNARVNDKCCKNPSCRSQSPSSNNQSTAPLLSHHSHEPPEMRRRRSSGKRVRGILMDFLKGCGDCRTTSGPENKVSPSILPLIRIRSGSPPPSLSTPIQQRTNYYGSTNKRCVHTECCKTCAPLLEVATEIEAQLKIFETEMERLRSRSQAVLGMLNTLHSADTN